MGHNISSAPMRSEMGSQRWLDWFGKLEKYVITGSDIVERINFSAAASYVSPHLDTGSYYEIVGALTPSVSTAAIALNFYNGSGIVSGANTYGVGYTFGGTATAAANRQSVLLTQGSSTAHQHPFQIQIFNARDAAVKTETLLNSVINSSGIKSVTGGQYRTAAEDNPKFQITAIAATTGAWTASGTFTGHIVIRRYPLEEV